MSKETFFRQCSLDLPLKNGVKRTVSWIPEKYAIKGKIIQLKKRETDEWENGWVVVMVGTIRLTQDQVTERSQDFKKQRKASDI